MYIYTTYVYRTIIWGGGGKEKNHLSHCGPFTKNAFTILYYVINVQASASITYY